MAPMPTPIQAPDFDGLSNEVADLKLKLRDLQEFSWGMLHDLREPIRVINGFSALLGKAMEQGDASRMAACVERIVRNTRSMNAMIDDLLRAARADSATLKRLPLDTLSIVEDIIELQREAGCAAVFEVGDFPLVNADEATMRQVWTNLISNAVKYSAKRNAPKIWIDCESTTEEVIFRIRDNGAGFESEHADKLFVAFQRLHSVRDFEGTGVGLATVRRIVERHGGRAWAVGEVGVGATFFIALPKQTSSTARRHVGA